MEKRVLFGWIFLIIGITPFLTFLTFSRAQYVVWFSNHAFIILGLALLLKSPFWAFAELCLGVVPELVWNIDFLYRVFSGSKLWGLSEYLFISGSFDWLHLYSLQHVFLIPAMLLSIYLLGGPVGRAWLGSLAQFAVLWGFSFAIGPELNINCVYFKCLFDLPFYQVSWPLLIVAHIFIVYYLVLLIYKKK